MPRAKRREDDRRVQDDPTNICKIFSGVFAAILFATLTGQLYASQQFGKVEYLPPKVEGQKHGSDPVRGQVIFDQDKKAVEYQSEKGQQVVSIPYEKIKTILYEKTSRPRYAEAILISLFFLFSKTKNTF